MVALLGLSYDHGSLKNLSNDNAMSAPLIHQISLSDDRKEDSMPSGTAVPLFSKRGSYGKRLVRTNQNLVGRDVTRWKVW